MPSEAHKLSFLPVLASVVLVIGSLYWAKFLDKNIYVYYHFDPNRHIENRASAR